MEQPQQTHKKINTMADYILEGNPTKVVHDLQHKICNGCGCLVPEFSRLFWMMQHPCNNNKVTYRPGSFHLRHLKNAISGIDPMACFNGLFNFASFEPMPLFEIATEQKKRWYQWQRESDIRTMLRLREYMKLEDELESKY